MYKYDYSQEDIDDVVVRLYKYHLINFTITFDPKKVSLKQAWDVARDPMQLMKDCLQFHSNLGYVISCETTKKGFPHFHGQILHSKKYSSLPKVIEQIRIQNSISRHMRNEFGRSQVLFNDDSPVSETSRTYTEYMLKDVLDNQSKYEGIPALTVMF